MAANPLYSSLDEFVPQTSMFFKALAKHPTGYGLVHNTAAKLQIKFEAITAAESEFQFLRGDRTKRVIPAVQEIDEIATKFAGDVKKLLAIHLGERWTTQWTEAGYTTPSLQMPNTREERLALVGKVGEYLGRHPHRENGDLEITAAKAKELHHALEAAMMDLKAHDTKMATAKKDRDQVVKALRKAMRSTINELKDLLEPDSPAWGDLGLNAPAAPPRRPTEVELQKKEERRLERQANKVRRETEKADKAKARKAKLAKLYGSDSDSGLAAPARTSGATISAPAPRTGLANGNGTLPSEDELLPS